MSRLRTSAVHPHAGGEHCAVPGGVLGPGGSSPRGWGTRAEGFRRRCRWRFIPTRVGNTWSSSAIRGFMTVHPHAGGEHGPAVRSHRVADGSSPRGWGTRPGWRHRCRRRRFIPTRVGNTAWAARAPVSRSVHPHAGGEHLSMTAALTGRAGSSPRGWGTRAAGVLGTVGRWFIPTRVGNTRGQASVSSGSSVHPHAGGEHHGPDRHPHPCAGSSPRGWGTPGRVLDVDDE